MNEKQLKNVKKLEKKLSKKLKNVKKLEKKLSKNIKKIYPCKDCPHTFHCFWFNVFKNPFDECLKEMEKDKENE